jgi:hypothetical protein
METQAQLLHRNRFSSLLARPRTSRLIATVGIVLLTVGLDLPVAARVLHVDGDPIHYQDAWAIGNAVRAPAFSLYADLYAARPASLYIALGFEAIYAVLIFGGLALIPLLWRSYSAKGTIALRWTYAVWLALLTMLALLSLPDWWQFISQPPTGLSDRAVTLATSYILPGAVVFPLGVLVGWAALVLLRRESLPTSVPAPAPRTRWQWVASLAISVGAFVWLVGFYLMPEAVTAACPPITFSVTHFAHGACAGVDSDQVRAAAGQIGLNPIARLFDDLTLNYELLVAAAGITVLGSWTRRLTMFTLAWLVVWPVLALSAALVALQGVGVIAQRGFKLTAETGGGWHAASGMVVTFVGIGLAMLGQLGLWRELVRRRNAANA